MASTDTETQERGSEQWAAERGIAPNEIKELMRLAQSVDGKLVPRWVKGQPAPDAVFGAVTVRPDGVGSLIQKLVGFKTLRPVLDVFPYGIPVIDEVLVRFEHGVSGIR